MTSRCVKNKSKRDTLRNVNEKITGRRKVKSMGHVRLHSDFLRNIMEGLELRKKAISKPGKTYLEDR